MTSQNTSPFLHNVGNRGPTLLAVSAIATGTALIFTTVRIFVRVKIVKFLGWDDMCIVVANVKKSLEHMIRTFVFFTYLHLEKILNNRFLRYLLFSCLHVMVSRYTKASGGTKIPCRRSRWSRF